MPGSTLFRRDWTGLDWNGMDWTGHVPAGPVGRYLPVPVRRCDGCGTDSVTRSDAHPRAAGRRLVSSCRGCGWGCAVSRIYLLARFVVSCRVVSSRFDSVRYGSVLGLHPTSHVMSCHVVCTLLACTNQPTACLNQLDSTRLDLTRLDLDALHSTLHIHLHVRPPSLYPLPAPLPAS
jgi:hypothetical protein